MDLFAYTQQATGCDPFAAPLPRACDAPADRLPPDCWRLVQVLDTHVGQAAAITAWELAQAAGIHPDGTRGSRERRVRQLIEQHLHRFPWPLCADATGYYRPETADEATHYHRNLYGRLRSIALRIATHRRLCLAAGFTHHGQGRYSRPDSP